MRLFLLLRLLLLLTFTLGFATAASADPGWPFRRTTPRGFLDQDPGGLTVGIPFGRAWGVESALLPLPSAGGAIVVDLAVEDPDVTEAFVRVAYYARADQRSRQLATVDSPFVRVGPGRTVRIQLDPPSGAVAYRVRILGRLAPRAVISRGDAIRARWAGGP